MPRKGTKMVRRPHTRHRNASIGGMVKVRDPLSPPTKVKGVWKKTRKR